MSSTEDFFTSFSFEKEIERAEWFKNDLDQGGWKEIHNSPGRVYWRKTFPENEVPLKILFKIAFVSGILPGDGAPQKSEYTTKVGQSFRGSRNGKNLPR